MRFITRRNRTIVIFFNLLFIAGCHGSDPLQVVQPHNLGIIDADITKALPVDEPIEKSRVVDSNYQNNLHSPGGSTRTDVKSIIPNSPDNHKKKIIKEKSVMDEAITDENFRNCVKSVSEDYSQVTYLHCRNKDIQQVEGLDLLVNLEELDLRMNSLSNIDLSKNTKLQSLNLSGNPLSAIDISQNQELGWLFLTGVPVSEIDVSHNKKLTWLNLSGTNISTIDLSDNTLLMWLFLADSNLDAIKLNNNKMLKKVDLSGTSISTLDISNNSKLAKLYLSDTNISAIDISNNNRLFFLDLSGTNISSFASNDSGNRCGPLKRISLSRTKIDDPSNIKMSACKKIKFIDLSNTKIRYFDPSHYQKLKELNLSGTLIETLNLNKNKNLTWLDVSKTSLPSINNLQSKKLTWLNMAETQITALNLSVQNNKNLDLKLFLALNQSIPIITVNDQQDSANYAKHYKDPVFWQVK